MGDKQRVDVAALLAIYRHRARGRRHRHRCIRRPVSRCDRLAHAPGSPGRLMTTRRVATPAGGGPRLTAGSLAAVFHTVAFRLSG
jgi:hypothetical protein